MSEAVESWEHAGVQVELHPDYDPMDPRDADMLGTMYCWHPDYILGDEQFGRGDHDSMADVARYLIDERGAIVVLPLYLLDHSGLSMRTGSELTPEVLLDSRKLQSHEAFMCDPGGWDTTMVGFIYTTREQVEYLGASEDVDELKHQLIAEIEEYDDYLRGESFVIVVAPDTPFEEAIGGFLGYEFARTAANEMAKDAARRIARETAERAEMAARDIVTLEAA